VRCGHLVGNFPHEDFHGNEMANYLHPENHALMRQPGKGGLPRDWILEIHFVDRAKRFGGFVEQLLTVD
jgi:hypothetical protein